MAAFRRSVERKQDARALGVMLHYLCNLFGVRDEPMFYARLAVRRAAFDARVTGRVAHGWEYRHLKQLRRQH